MKSLRSQFLLIWSFCLVPIAERAQSWAWANDAGNVADNYGPKMCVSSRNEIILATNRHYDDQHWPRDSVHVEKYDADGKKIWAKSIDGWTRWISDITTDSLGNVYVLGYFYNKIAFDDTTCYPNNSLLLSFLGSFDANGQRRWFKVLGKGSGGCNYIVSMPTGELVSVGLSDSASSTNWQIKKYDNSGNSIGQSTISSNNYIYGGLRGDSFGNLYAFGLFQNGCIINGTNYSTPLATQYSDCANSFVAKFNMQAEVKSVQVIYGAFHINDVAIDDEGNIIAAAVFQDSMQIHTTKLYADCKQKPCYATSFIKLSPSGSVLWVRKTAAAIRSLFVSGVDVYAGGGILGPDTVEFDSVRLVEPEDRSSAYVAGFSAYGLGACAVEDGGISYSDCDVIQIGGNSSGIYVCGIFRNPYNPPLIGDSWFDTTHLPITGADYHYYLAKVGNLRQLTGVPFYSMENNFLAYPNPFQESITIFSRDPARFQLFNLFGEIVYTEYISGFQTINIPNIVPGIYFAECTTSHKKTVLRIARE
jgi:hypothetical protein